MTKEQELRLLDILANAFGSAKPIAERTDLMEALTALRTEIDDKSPIMPADIPNEIRDMMNKLYSDLFEACVPPLYEDPTVWGNAIAAALTGAYRLGQTAAVATALDKES